IVEDIFDEGRNVRCSVSTFTNIGKIIEDTPLLATVPRIVGEYMKTSRRHMGTAELPFALEGSSTELLWPAATDDDEACAFLREAVVDVVGSKVGRRPKGRRALLKG